LARSDRQKLGGWREIIARAQALECRSATRWISKRFAEPCGGPFTPGVVRAQGGFSSTGGLKNLDRRSREEHLPPVRSRGWRCAQNEPSVGQPRSVDSHLVGR
jgi:hypothetical protein